MRKQCFANSSLIEITMDITGMHLDSYSSVAIVFYLSVGISIIGLIGNMVSILILRTKDMFSVGTMLLLPLAITDAILLILFNTFYLLLISDQTRVRNIVRFSLIHILMCLYTAELYITLALISQRTVAVVFPFKHKSWVTRKSNKIVLITIILFSIVCEILIVLSNSPTYMWDLTANKTSSTFKFDEERHQQFVVVYEVGIASVIRIVFPIVWIFICSVLILRSLVLPSPSSGNATMVKKKQKLTVITLAISTVSLIVILYSSIANIWLQSDFVLMSMESCNVIAYTIHCLVCFNYSVNWIFYCLVGSKFRKTLLKYIRRLKREHDTTSGMTSYTIS